MHSHYFDRPIHALVKRITPPAAEPIDVATAKNHLRLPAGVTADDDRVAQLITAARILVEKETRRSLITTEWQLQLERFPIARYTHHHGTHEDRFGAINLPRMPFQSLVSLTYVDQAGATQTLAVDTDFAVESGDDDRRARVMPLFGKYWPGSRCYPGSVLVQYKAGYGDAGDTVPGPLTQAMLLLIGHWYENREAVTLLNTIPQVLQLGFSDLIASFIDYRNLDY